MSGTIPAAPCFTRTPDSRGYVPLRHNALCGTRRAGDNCGLDALAFCVGNDRLVYARDLLVEPSACTVADLARAVKNKTQGRLILSRVRGQSTPLKILTAPGGIFMVRVQVRSGDTLRHHFLGVDTWRSVIFDNDIDPGRRFVVWCASDETSDAASALFKDLGVVRVAGVHACLEKVRAV